MRGQNESGNGTDGPSAPPDQPHPHRYRRKSKDGPKTDENLNATTDDIIDLVDDGISPIEPVYVVDAGSTGTRLYRYTMSDWSGKMVGNGECCLHNGEKLWVLQTI